MAIRFQLETRKQITINTDPQKRCYNGVNASESVIWSNWDWLEYDVKKEKIKERLQFWRDLNKYSVSIGGKKSEYRIIEISY